MSDRRPEKLWTNLILCSGYCEHGKFMGECIDCALAELEEE